MKKLIVITILCYSLQTAGMKKERNENSIREISSLKKLSLKEVEKNYPKKLSDFLKVYKLIESNNIDHTNFIKNISKLELKDSDLKKIEKDGLNIPSELFTNELTLFKEYPDKQNFNQEKIEISNFCFNSSKNQFAYIENKNELIITNFSINPALKRSILLETKQNDYWWEKIDFNNDETIIACAINNEVYFYNILTLEKIKNIIPNHSDVIRKVKFSPDGIFFAIATDNDLVIYNKDLQTIHVDLKYKYIQNFNFNSDGKFIIIGRFFGEVIVYDIKNKKPLYIKKIDDNLHQINFIGNNSAFLIGSNGSYTVSESDIIQLSSSIGMYYRFSYDNIQNIIGLNRMNLRIVIKNCNNLQQIVLELNPKNSLSFLHFSRDGNYLALISKYQKNISLYNVPVFQHTAQQLNQKQRNFVFFCDYWQRNGITIPEQYLERYNDLPENLKIKFNNILPKEKEKLIQEAQQQHEEQLQQERGKIREENVERRVKIQEELEQQLEIQKQLERQKQLKEQQKHEKEQKKITFTQKIINTIKPILPAAVMGSIYYLVYKYFNAPKKTITN